jgi:membrane dipeptidase
VHWIFDSHLDLSWNALSWDRDQTLELAELNRRDAAMGDDGARGHATVTLPEMRRAGVAVCLGTVLVRSKPNVCPPEGHRRTSLDFPSQSIAYSMGQGQLAYYRLLEREGHLRMLRTSRELDAHWAQWEARPTGGAPLGLILAMEGADPITSPGQAEEWFEAGLRCVNLVHYGKGPYAVGTGEEGPLTTRGVELLKEIERLGILLDVTHLSDRSFFETLDRFDGPVHASHQNCRAIVPGCRQFTDDQIRLVIERGGVLGACCDAWMLKEGWQRGITSREGVPLERLADHIDRVCDIAGNHDHCGIGSDLDGGFGSEQTPAGLDSIADLQKLDAILAARGYGSDAIRAIFHGNWLRFFREHLPR